MNITKKLEAYLLKSGIFGKYEKRRQALEAFFHMTGRRLEKETQLAVVCDAEAGNRFILKTNVKDKTKAFIEADTTRFRVNGWRRKIYGIDVITYEDIYKYQNCTIVVIDDCHFKQLFNYVYYPDVKIIHLADEIKMFYPELYHSYMEWMVTYNTPFEKIMLIRRKYEKAYEKNKKKSYLEQLIFELLCIRDIHSSIRYMDEYLSDGYDSDGSMKEFRKKLLNFMDEISCLLKKRNSLHDIIMVWNDGLRYDELKDMEFLGNEFASHALCFTNAFSTVYDSEGSLGSMFQKKYQVDDFHVSEGESYDADNSPVIRMIEEHGYQFKTIFHFYLADRRYTKLIDTFTAGSEKLWMCIQNLLETEGPLFFLLQENTETHNPYHCPYINRDYYFENDCTPLQYQNQIAVSRAYWDKQMAFYFQLLDYDNTKIIMSDHGKPVTLHDLCVPDWGYLSDYLHIVFMAAGKRIRKGNNGKLFSGYYFKEFLNYILNPDEENLEKCFPGEFVKIQAIDRYNAGDIERKLKAGTDKRHLMSYRGIRTQEDMYIEIANGEERYFRLPDERQNRIHDPHYSERIGMLKRLNKGSFLDIGKIPFFHASGILYENE